MQVHKRVCCFSELTDSGSFVQLHTTVCSECCNLQMAKRFRLLILPCAPVAVVVNIIVTTWTTTIINFREGKINGVIDVAAFRLPFMMSHNVLRIEQTRGIPDLLPSTHYSSCVSSSSPTETGCTRLMSQISNHDVTGSNNSINGYHDVVLFGIGDLRVDDHGGLIRAVQLQRQNKDSSTGIKNNIHCCFLCTDSVLSNICGVASHTIDVVNCIASAVHELDTSLKENNFNPLHSIMTSTEASEELDIFSYIQDHIIVPSTSTKNERSTKVRIHVCDLGPIDNYMRYGAYGQLQLQQRQTDTTSIEYEIIPWNSTLRTAPYERHQGTNYNKFPIFYPTYQSLYCTTNDFVLEPQKVPNVNATACSGKAYNSTSATIPSSTKILDRLKNLLPIDHDVHDTANTGLFGSHFGGISSENTVGCMSILQHLSTYCYTCNEDDTTFRQFIQKESNFRMLLTPKRNIRSLEHAAMIWQLDGGYENWLDGEVMIRLLLIPLYLGTISPRRIWHTAGRPRQSIIQTTLWNPPPLRTLVEGREWHNLLAARQFYDAEQHCGATSYKYWRYHGLLCRYAQTDFALDVDNKMDREGVLLVHGFGASGSQWNKAMSALSNLSTALHQGLAPDLIGFGHSEKPSISYTSYMWDSQIMDFVKDVAIPRHKWRNFITGGNSIGGYTSMSFAACDAAASEHVTSSGSSGTHRCVGLVLMNSAGPIKTKDEMELERQRQAEGVDEIKSMSIAITTASLKLPTCKPPPRPVARLFGNALLAYLRPNIQSICKNLYPTNQAAVDDQLVQDIERDSLDPGAINVMMAGAKLPPPRTSNELLGARFGGASSSENGILESSFTGPVLIAQGVLDPLNNSTDRMNRFFSLREGIDVAPIEAGHCPHDELPMEVAQSIADWRLALTPISAN
jgi:pimeloyl-ACP methyl ester carboxylesterase